MWVVVTQKFKMELRNISIHPYALPVWDESGTYKTTSKYIHMLCCMHTLQHRDNLRESL